MGRGVALCARNGTLYGSGREQTPLTRVLEGSGAHDTQQVADTDRVLTAWCYLDTVQNRTELDVRLQGRMTVSLVRGGVSWGADIS